MKTRKRAQQRSAFSLVLPQLLLSVLLLGLSYSESAHAYAWMIRHDYTACATCHADPSGGELLTQYGRVTADMVLRMQYSEPEEAKEPSPGVLFGLWETPKGLLLGGSYRSLAVFRPGLEGAEFSYIPVMQGDLYGQLKLGPVRMGGSVGIGRSVPGSPHGRAAQVTPFEDSYNLLSRTHYVGVDIGDKYLLRAGRLNLPFGIRMPEHTTFVREATRTDRDTDQQHGIAISYVGERLRGELMAIAGNYQVSPDAYRERGYSLFVEGIAGTTFGSGISSKVTYAQRDRLTEEQDTLRQAHGIFARWAPLSVLTFLFEADALFRTRANAGYAAFLQADYEPITGLHFMLTGEALDRGRSFIDPLPVQPGQGDPKFGGWASVDWFFFKQLEFRMDAIFRSNEPFTLLGQLHMYL